MAIGECGLDKICETDFALQEQLFVLQIELANKIQKPLIIHCVKAFDEVLRLLKVNNNRVPVIFHGFHKSVETAFQITRQGYYLSFGKALLHQRMQEMLAKLPLTNCFLETDDASINIETMYELAASAFSIDKDSLSLQLQKNAAKVFNLK